MVDNLELIKWTTKSWVKILYTGNDKQNKLIKILYQEFGGVIIKLILQFLLNYRKIYLFWNTKKSVSEVLIDSNKILKYLIYF